MATTPSDYSEASRSAATASTEEFSAEEAPPLDNEALARLFKQHERMFFKDPRRIRLLCLVGGAVLGLVFVLLLFVEQEALNGDAKLRFVIALHVASLIVAGAAYFLLIAIPTSLRTASAYRVFIRDPRDLILILRAFVDDDFQVDAGARTPVASLENFVVDALRGLGPPIALGRPSDRLARSGAGRLYVANSEWRYVVTSLLRRSRVVVFLLRSSRRGILWEIDTALRTVPMHRLMFVRESGHEGIYGVLRSHSSESTLGEADSRGEGMYIEQTVADYYKARIAHLLSRVLWNHLPELILGKIREADSRAEGMYGVLRNHLPESILDKIDVRGAAVIAFDRSGEPAAFAGSGSSEAWRFIDALKQARLWREPDNPPRLARPSLWAIRAVLTLINVMLVGLAVLVCVLVLYVTGVAEDFSSDTWLVAFVLAIAVAAGSFFAPRWPTVLSLESPVSGARAGQLWRFLRVHRLLPWIIIPIGAMIFGLTNLPDRSYMAGLGAWAVALILWSWRWNGRKSGVED